MTDNLITEPAASWLVTIMRDIADEPTNQPTKEDETMFNGNISSGLACIDCTVVIANDDYSGMNEDRAIVVRESLSRLNREGYNLNVDTYDSESHFSGSDCDVCQSRLAGDRVPVTFIW